MSKQPNDVLTSLELAVAYLQQARQHLIRCDSLGDRTQSALLRAAGLLETLKKRGQFDLLSESEKRAYCQLLLAVRANAARAQLLLDTAVSFHCGAALAGPAVPDTYTPDGDWQTIYPNDQICLNA